MQQAENATVADATPLDAVSADPVSAAEPTAGSTADPSRRLAAEGTVKSSMIAAMGIGLVPIPLVGMGGLLATNVAMVASLARQYEVPFREDAVKTAVMALLAGGLPFGLGVTVSEALKFIPGFGSVAGPAGTSLLAGAATYAVGRVFLAHFESGGDLLSLDMSTMRERFKVEVQRGREIAAKSMDFLRRRSPAEAAATETATAPEPEAPAKAGAAAS